MLTLLRQWQDSGDATTLSHPTTAVYSRGDANLLNWHHHDNQTYVVDFEYSGHSDIAVDAADHIEHISARTIPDHIWTNTEAAIGINQTNRTRFNAAQRTIALRWLAVLWKQRHKRTLEFITQHRRVHALFN
jgi:thiamine kinase-like enzyme